MTLIELKNEIDTLLEGKGEESAWASAEVRIRTRDECHEKVEYVAYCGGAEFKYFILEK